jgi:general secretion pathway protein J
MLPHSDITPAIKHHNLDVGARRAVPRLGEASLAPTINMFNCLHNNRGAKGFTLIEILIALALLGVLAGALYGTYFSLIRGRESAVEGMEARRELRTTLDLLRRELNSAIYRTVPGGTKNRLHFSVEDRDIFGKPASRLAFTTIAPPQPGGLIVSDQVDLLYEVVEREKKMVLSRQAKDLYHSGEPGRYPQMESIEGFLVECKTKNNDKWVKSWDTANDSQHSLPETVRVTVTVKEGEKSASYSILASPKIMQ